MLGVNDTPSLFRRQQAFVKHCSVYWNASRAARKAGYPAASANTTSNQLPDPDRARSPLRRDREADGVGLGTGASGTQDRDRGGEAEGRVTSRDITGLPTLRIGLSSSQCQSLIAVPEPSTLRPNSTAPHRTAPHRTALGVRRAAFLPRLFDPVPSLSRYSVTLADLSGSPA